MNVFYQQRQEARQRRMAIHVCKDTEG